MKIFVTGSTSFLGSALVSHIISRGHEVIALVDDLKAARNRIDPAAELVEGKMTNISSFKSHLEGCHAVVNAGHFREKKGVKICKDRPHFRVRHCSNADAVISLLRACEDSSVPTFVHISTVGVFEGSSDESMPFKESSKNKYFQAKIKVQKAIEEWSSKRALESMKVVSIFPSAIAGPGDNKPTTLGQAILRTASGKKKTCPPGSINIVDVRDVAAIILAAIETGENNERYIASAEHITMQDLLRTVGDISHVHNVPRSMPYAFAWAKASLSELNAKILSKPRNEELNMVRTLLEVLDVSGLKANKKLNISYRPLKETLADQINWFKQVEMI